MMTRERQEHPLLRWFSIDSPYIWLAYLPLFFLPWFISAPTTPQLVGGGAGILAFLGLYISALRTTGVRLIGYAAAILILSYALAFTFGNWTVISVYAASLLGNLRPARRAIAFVVAFTIATLVAGLSIQQDPLYWGLGVFLMLMVGAANISRAALEDKTRALASAQEEVKQMAATAERERIGRDLHDLLGRTLTLIAIKADLSVKLSARDPASAETQMREVAAAARTALAEVRAAVAGMTGATLSHEIASARTALGAAGIACIVDGDAETIDHGAGAVLAMTLREAVTNVIRHSGARSCRILVIRGANGLELTVSDDGDGGAVREGGGIGGVRSRLAAAGGHLRVTGAADGTKLVAYVPAGVSA